jgi:hypothetical protein
MLRRDFLQILGMASVSVVVPSLAKAGPTGKKVKVSNNLTISTNLGKVLASEEARPLLLDMAKTAPLKQGMIYKLGFDETSGFMADRSREYGYGVGRELTFESFEFDGAQFLATIKDPPEALRESLTNQKKGSYWSLRPTFKTKMVHRQNYIRLKNGLKTDPNYVVTGETPGEDVVLTQISILRMGLVHSTSKMDSHRENTPTEDRGIGPNKVILDLKDS